MGWQVILAFFLGLICRLTITREPNIDVYKRGFKDGLEVLNTNQGCNVDHDQVKDITDTK